MEKSIVAFAVAFLFACGGDDDGGPLSEQQAESVCEDFCSACDFIEECMSDCVRDSTADCANGDAFRFLVDCLGDTCEFDDVNQCINQIPISEEVEDWAAACRDKLAECGQSSNEISAACDTDNFRFLSSGVVNEARACFQEDCAAIDACLEAAREQC